MVLSDARAAGPPFVEGVRAAALAGPPAGEIPLKRYQLPKNDGGRRVIQVQNLGERLLHRAFSGVLTPVLDGLLSASSYAYRRGLSYKHAATALKRLLGDGYTHGLKADITAFFDSVDSTALSRLLRGLFPGEPLVRHLDAWLGALRRQGIPGLPQGWSLSPGLSNLYLDRFDRAMEREGFRLVRFADDFVVLFRPELSAEEGVRVVEEHLGRLGLALKPEKSRLVVRGEPVTFLGYVVGAGEMHPVGRPDEPMEADWLPVFRPDWKHGMPVYLTSTCRGAFSNGPNLVVKHGDGGSGSVPWNRVSRLVVVGRSSFSGGVVYRSMRERIPVTFIDVMGRTTGHLHAVDQDTVDHTALLIERCNDPQWVLSLARRLVSAKIHNSMVLLRRNGIAAPELKLLEKESRTAGSLARLRGLEGSAARVYFGYFGRLTTPFPFSRRRYHPPDGAVNVLLSFGYTLLYNRLAAVLRDKGLNPRQGVYHVGRGRHCALASDLLEPLRHLAERIVLSLIHLKELTPENFQSQRRGGYTACRMDGDGFRTFIARYEHTMSARFTPRQGDRMSYNAWLDETVDALVREVRYAVPCQPLRID